MNQKLLSHLLSIKVGQNLCNEELLALKPNETWNLIPRSEDMNVNGSKWVFKTKLKLDDSLDRLKARLVAKGFH